MLSDGIQEKHRFSDSLGRSAPIRQESGSVVSSNCHDDVMWHTFIRDLIELVPWITARYLLLKCPAVEGPPFVRENVIGFFIFQWHFVKER